MEIKKRVVFRMDEAAGLIAYLRKNQIPFEENYISVIELLESDPRWPAIAEIVEQEDLICQSETVFTKQELDSAEWLQVRSQWKCGYPQPEANFEYETITYTRKGYCSECGSGLQQINPFRLRKPIKWGKRHFAELNWVGDELFISDTAKQLLQDGQTTGIFHMDVLDKKGSERIEGITQLRVESVLESGLLSNRDSIRETSICPQCGTVKHVPSGVGMLAMQREIFAGQPDIVKSGDCFGSGHYSTRIIIVRQKVYQLIVKNQLDRGLVFEPIELI